VRRSALHLASALLLCLATPLAGQTSGVRLGAKDLLRIKVAEVPELNVETRISDAGSSCR
jgi:protein involved in polysaccharide export with SLBB domain